MLRLASGEVATVDACACGTVHLHLGTITVRLTHAALDSLRCTLEDAVVASTLALPCRTADVRH